MLTISHPQRRGGRPKGPDGWAKTPADLREMLLGALEDVGGRKYLAQRAIDTPGQFLTLLGKVLPTSVANADGSALNLHLLAAQLMSQELLRAAVASPTINGHAETPQSNALLIADAEPPLE